MSPDGLTANTGDSRQEHQGPHPHSLFHDFPLTKPLLPRLAACSMARAEILSGIHT